MQPDTGDPTFPIWLLGDSNPVNWQDSLAHPLDPRHPARHNIWTAVLDPLQDRVFRARGLRLDSSRLYIRNAVEDPSERPSATDTAWPPATVLRIADLASRLDKYRPFVVFSFGSFSFEGGRRALSELPHRRPLYWNTRRLGAEFRERVDGFSSDRVNLLPLLHVSIARGRFLQSHAAYTEQPDANYFAYVANSLAPVLLDTLGHLPIWLGD